MVTLILVLGWLSLSNQVITFTFFVSEIALYALDVYYNQTYLNQQSKYQIKIGVYCQSKTKRIEFHHFLITSWDLRNEEGALLSLSDLK